MRVAFLTHGIGNGGTERMICRLSNAFVKRGIDVSILVISDCNQTYELDKCVEVLYSGRGIRSKAVRMLQALKMIRSFLKKKSVDILLCFIITTIPFAVLSGIGLKKEYKIIGAERSNPKVMNPHYKKIVEIFLNFCDGFVFQTKGVQKMYPSIIQKKSTIIGNIVPDIIPMNDIGRGRVPYGICSVGRLHNDKDFSTVIQAFGIVEKVLPDASLHIYGDGPERKELENLAVTAGIGEKVFFEGFSENMMQEIQRYEVFVFSSKAEGMPNALMEAMAAGLACVSTDCDFGPADLIDDGVNGCLVGIGDSEKMAEALISLLRMPDKRMKMGEMAKKIGVQYSENNIVEKYINYFEQILC